MTRMNEANKVFEAFWSLLFRGSDMSRCPPFITCLTTPGRDQAQETAVQNAQRCAENRRVGKASGKAWTKLSTPVICPQFAVLEASWWHLIPCLWGICDSPDLDVQAAFLLFNHLFGRRCCIQSGPDWLLSIHSLHRFDLNHEVIFARWRGWWWNDFSAFGFRSCHSIRSHVLRFDLYSDIATRTRCLCLNGAVHNVLCWSIVNGEDLCPHCNSRNFRNVHFLWVLEPALTNLCCARHCFSQTAKLTDYSVHFCSFLFISVHIHATVFSMESFPLSKKLETDASKRDQALWNPCRWLGTCVTRTWNGNERRAKMWKTLSFATSSSNLGPEQGSAKHHRKNWMAASREMKCQLKFLWVLKHAKELSRSKVELRSLRGSILSCHYLQSTN